MDVTVSSYVTSEDAGSAGTQRCSKSDESIRRGPNAGSCGEVEMPDESVAETWSPLRRALRNLSSKRKARRYLEKLQLDLGLDDVTGDQEVDGEKSFPLTEHFYRQLRPQDVSALEKHIADHHLPQLPAGPAVHRQREILRRGHHLLPSLFEARTGLENLAPPEHIHSMEKQEANCGSLYYGDLICESLQRLGMTVEDGQTVLDFGCSSGRVLRSLQARFPRARWFGSDTITETIDWNRRMLPQIEFEVSPQAPPTRYRPGQFSLVYAISVWSHFSPQRGLEWFDEMHRITRPGAPLIFSTHGLGTLRYLNERRAKGVRDLRSTTREVLMESIAFEDVFGVQGDWGNDLDHWGNTYMLPCWPLTHLTPRWQVRDYRPRRVEDNQDLYVLQRR